MKKLCLLLLSGVIILSVGVFHATADLTLIGTANYLGNDYNLIYEDDGPFGPITWLDYSRGWDNWYNHVNWASILGGDLTVTLYPGITADIDWSTGWRLPETMDVPFDGITLYNITTSEMGHLYYQSLGNSGNLTNTSYFLNLNADYYKSGTEWSIDTRLVWLFNFRNGGQDADGKSSDVDYALAVRPGQVLFVPEPESNAPLSDAGPIISISSEQHHQTVIQGTASDPDFDTLTYRWLEGATELSVPQPVGTNGEAYLDLSLLPFFALGEHTLTLEVSDGQAVSSDIMILTVRNSAPHPAAAGGGVYEIFSTVYLGGQVSDFDADTVFYEWLEAGQVLYTGTVETVYSGAPVTLPVYAVSNLTLGWHALTLRVNDGVNLPSTSDIYVQIIDTEAPTLIPVPNKTILWPPNHSMTDITIQANASDNSGMVTLSEEIYSNEPQEGFGDGDTSPDWTEPVIDQINGIISFQLRAERSGSGEGRTYSILITASDSSNNASQALVQIIVPHDKRR